MSQSSNSILDERTIGHTPGPWAYDFAPEPGHASEFIVLGPRNAELAYVGADEARGVLGPTVEANARLIAAAPELLGALADCRKELFDRINRLAVGMSDETRAKYMAHPSLVRADAAITKAEGRES